MLELIILGTFALLAVVEMVRPRQHYAASPFWRTRGAIGFILYLAVGTFAPFLWDDVLASHRLFDLTTLPVWQQALIGFLVAELVGYSWHRSMHTSNFLWRAFHQMHHSAERFDIWGAFYFSPQDMVGFTFFGSLALVGIVGIGGEAGLVVNLTLLFLTAWQHMNIKTPHWMGYIIVRPESHSVHHARGVHKYNYCDVPLIDMLFGTFRNPKEIIPEAGFYDGASLEVPKMIAGFDVLSSYAGPSPANTARASEATAGRA
ncbi:sterol desaturase family protein [Kordiimonas lipolytica]|uniref:Sterol desaturase family protein n=1 Tax=Kordiimonas lipolytica TaxID=1662421 RepID=A0ABV8UF61_9PROT|nr:sterol desaturase family protein [Kordiimonas lipolytica]